MSNAAMDRQDNEPPIETQTTATAAPDSTGSAEEDEDFPPPPFLKADFKHPLYPKLVEALKEVYDPEIPVDIFELGLIYNMEIRPDMTIDVKMTLTAPGCPVAGEMPGWVSDAVESVEEIKGSDVEIVWDPPWTPDMMSEFAKMELGMF